MLGLIGCRYAVKQSIILTNDEFSYERQGYPGKADDSLITRGCKALYERHRAETKMIESAKTVLYRVIIINNRGGPMTVRGANRILQMKNGDEEVLWLPRGEATFTIERPGRKTEVVILKIGAPHAFLWKGQNYDGHVLVTE
jgi:hypothetical protein